ncbi:hypothetical protein [Maritalea porphyrae]|uniref:hypothetical protein n=1 Tax=Maritalea porphyrae TaxID=880732 RepID=UPI0022AF8AB7|nr:hypothetical protein [Maritalea porphyrae]MCZ4272137.1 hypothetical protein [Maritalea porphyrae]
MIKFDFATNMGNNPNSVALIGDIAADLEFATVRPYMGLADAERLSKTNPVNFFLFDYGSDFEKTVERISEIRASHQLRVRFAPLICFVETPSKESIIECVNAGFDDILTIPWVASSIKNRLAKQVNTKNVYFETDSYFGPDRRRYNDEAKKRGEKAPASGFGFRRYEFVRNNFAGVQIMQDKVVGKAPRRQSAASNKGVQHRMSI